ncbi:GTP-binding protein [Uliginosibacterium sp. TH139]|uniref:CobW family GTP-binding protein n=1 Tax=Uliginosibacterium sp. TH139 TaxID=2067453 RepID=UPI000C7D4B95|nr:GTP-binding protein [Uliginosibacterium sp. TH139]PLK50712.1 GTP-binding protein [Uliginosibacterium sp. TH139]
MATDKRIPVVLLTGFLGSGKTSLLNSLLRAPEMAGAAVLINEVGAVGLDHLLVEQVSEDITLLESGCLCCTVRGDLSRSLRDLFMRRLRREIGQLDRVVIETTGLADPAPVIHTLLKDFFLAERFRLEGVITTVDVRHVHWQLGQHPEAVKQVAMADRVVLTKCDLADSLMIAEAEERVRELNPAADLWHGEPGKLPSGLLEGMSLYAPEGKMPDVAHWLNESAIREQQRLNARHGVFGQTAPAAALHDEAISTHVLHFSEPFAWGDFARALDTLQSVVGEHILRIKGLVAVEGEDLPRVIHAVQHERYPDSQLPAWPDEDRRSRLVFIVRELPRSVLEKAFSAFCSAQPDASI